MRNKIFLSYRRADASGHAGRLFDSLSIHFGPERVFMDVDGIRGGSNFLKSIEQEFDSTGALLVVIGQNWLKAVNEDGARRLDLPDDFVRSEILTAISQNILIIPVLTQGANMPSKNDLPAELKVFAQFHAVAISDERWSSDVTRLAKLLELDVPGSVAERKFNTLKQATIALIFIAVVTAVIKEVWIASESHRALYYGHIVSMIGATILLPMVARYVESNSRKYMWLSFILAGLSIFLLYPTNFFPTINKETLAIIPETALLGLLNLSTFNPR